MLVSPKVLSREAGGILDRGRELNHKIVNSVDANVEVAEVCTLAFIFALTWLVASGRASTRRSASRNGKDSF
jgi:hypothetical protein